MVDINNMTLAELKKAIKREAKTANQRLRQLEGKTKTNTENLSKSSVAYKYIERLAFDNTDYISRTGKGEIKFNTALTGRSIGELKSELTSIRGFLKARTSTVGGLKNVAEEAWEKYKEATGTSPSFGDFSELYTDSLIQNIQKVYGSDAIVRIFEAGGDDLSAEDIIKIMTDAGFDPADLGKDEDEDRQKEFEKIIKAFEEHKNKGV